MINPSSRINNPNSKLVNNSGFEIKNPNPGIKKANSEQGILNSLKDELKEYNLFSGIKSTSLIDDLSKIFLKFKENIN